MTGSEPRTEAGRAMLAYAYQGSCADCLGNRFVNGHRREYHGLVADVDAETILAIENEAVQAERERLRGTFNEEGSAAVWNDLLADPEPPKAGVG